MPDESIAGVAESRIWPRISFRFAHHTLSFSSSDPSVRFFVHESHDPFVVPDSSPVDCAIDWRMGVPEPSAGPPDRVAVDRWELRNLPEGEEIVFRNGVGNDATMRMRFDRAFSRCDIVQAARPGSRHLAFASEYPWAEYVTCRLLGRDGGLLLHASTCVRDGVAYLFMGHSGAGKSTISELAESVGAFILSDDRTIITMEKGVPTAWGTPWHGSFARTASGSAPIHSIALLFQDREDRLDRIPPQQALKETFVRLIQPRITPADVQQNLATLEDVIRLVPVNALHFLPTPAAFELAARQVGRVS